MRLRWVVGVGLMAGLAWGGLVPGLAPAASAQEQPEGGEAADGDPGGGDERDLAQLGMTTDLDDPSAILDRIAEIRAEAEGIPEGDPWRSSRRKVIDDEQEVLRARLDHLRTVRALGRKPPPQEDFDAARRRIQDLRAAEADGPDAARVAALTETVLAGNFGEVLVREVFGPAAEARATERSLASQSIRLDAERLSLPVQISDNDARTRATVLRIHDLQTRALDADALGTVEASLVWRRLELNKLAVHHQREKAGFLDQRNTVLLAWRDLIALRLRVARLERLQIERLQDAVLDGAVGLLQARLATAREAERAADPAAADTASTVQTPAEMRARNTQLEREMLEWRLHSIASWRWAAEAAHEVDLVNAARQELFVRFIARAGGDDLDGTLIPTRVERVLARPFPEMPAPPQGPDGEPLSPADTLAQVSDALERLDGSTTRSAAAAPAGAADDAVRTQLRAQRKVILEATAGDLQHVVWLETSIRGTLTQLVESRESVRAMIRRRSVVERVRGRVTLDSMTRAIQDLGDAPAALVRTWGTVRSYLARQQGRDGALAVGLVGLVAALVFLGVRWRLGVAPTGEDGRSDVVLARIALFRSLCAAVVVGTPFVAAAFMLPALTPFAYSFFLVCGIAIVGLIGGRAANEFVARGTTLARGAAVDDPTGHAIASVRRGVARLLLLTCTLAPFVYLLGLSGSTNEGVIRLLWWGFGIAAVVVLVRNVLRHDALAHAAFPPKARGGAAMASAFRGIRRGLIVAAPVLVVLELLGYGVFAELLASFALALVAVFAVVMAVMRSPARAALEGVTGLPREVVKIASLLVVAGIAGWVALSVHDVSLVDVKSTLDLPLPFQDPGADDRIAYVDVLRAIGIVFLFLGLARAMRGSVDKTLKNATTLDRGLRYTIVELLRYVTLALGAYLALRQLFDLSAIGYLVAALGVGIGFGLQEIVGNFVSGLILLFERPIKVGDLVEVGTHTGIVEHISIRATTVQTFDNISLLIPNREFVSQPVTNFTHDDLKFRDRIEVGVAYGTDLALAKKLLLGVAAKDDNVLSDPPPEVYFLGFGDSSLNLALGYWGYGQRRMAIMSALYFAVDAAFREGGITIPFPQRDVHIIQPENAADDEPADDQGAAGAAE